MRQECVEAKDTPAQISAATVISLDQRTKEMMPSETNCKHIIWYHRKKKPSTLKELKIEGDWQTTCGAHSKTFLRFDNGSDTESRIVILTTDECFPHLNKSITWYMDGNFKMVPKFVYAVCTCSELVIPLCQLHMSFVKEKPNPHMKSCLKPLFKK